jgi:hypothetical protein
VAQRGGKAFNQDSARQAYLRTLKGLSDQAALKVLATGFVVRNDPVAFKLSVTLGVT